MSVDTTRKFVVQMQIEELSVALTNWMELNKALRKASEGDCMMLMHMERKRKNRRQYLLRIHSRMNRLRAVRERKEISLPRKDS